MKRQNEWDVVLVLEIIHSEGIIEIQHDRFKTCAYTIASYFKLSRSRSLQTKDERKFMQRVSYSSSVGSLMYSMVCSMPDLTYAVSMVSRFMANPGKQHWEVLK